MARTLLLPGDRPFVNLALLAATIASTFFSFFYFLSPVGSGIAGPLAYSLCTVAILGAHEMGHYVLARLHGVESSLPYFIPLPLWFGTLGAVIRIRSPFPSRNALMDIGAAGPLAGLAVALPVLVIGLSFSEVVPAPIVASGFPHPLSTLGLVEQGLHRALELFFGADAQPVRSPPLLLYGDGLLMQGLQRLVVGRVPDGSVVYHHPMVTAGWLGLLVTLLNLCPIGQLDGGHVAYALFGEKARSIGHAAGVGLLFLALFYSVTWVAWLLLTTQLIGFGHPEVEDAEAPLSRGRRLVGALCFFALVGCVVPVPIQQVAMP